MSSAPVTTAFGLSKLTDEQRKNVFLTIVEYGGRRLSSVAFQKLRRMDLTDPKRVFKAKFRYLCKKSMAATRTSKDGTVHANTPPRHSTEATILDTDGNKVDGYVWTKWIVRGESNVADITGAGALEIVMPAGRTEAEVADTATIMAVLKDVVLKALTFAARPHDIGVPLAALLFVPADDSVPVRTSVVRGGNSRTVDMWYTYVGGGGYMIFGAGRDGMSAARLVKLRLLAEMTTDSDSGKKKKKGKTSDQRYREEHLTRHAAVMAARSANFDAALAASSRS